MRLFAGKIALAVFAAVVLAEGLVILHAHPGPSREINKAVEPQPARLATATLSHNYAVPDSRWRRGQLSDLGPF